VKILVARTASSHYNSSIQGPSTPTEDGEASIPMEQAMRRDNDPHMNQYPTFTVRRKAAKRTFPWDIPAEEIQLALTRPHDDDGYVRETNRPRLEEPVPRSTDEAPTENTAHNITVALPAADNAPTATAATESEPVTDTHPNVRATGTSHFWKPAEDEKLTRAITSTRKKKHKGRVTIDWAAICALVSGRTRKQCKNRWHKVLDPSIDRTNGRTGKWKEDEDVELKNAVHKHDGKDWVAIAALVQGRTKKQCQSRWRDVSDPRTTETNGRTGKWEEEEVIKLKAAVQIQGVRDWAAVAALVPGRTKKQCFYRWRDVSNPITNQVNGRTGKWNEDEDIKLKAAVQIHGDKDWVAISAQVSGRTTIQCHNRWRNTLDPRTNQANGRTGKWKEEEDTKLKDAVHKHGGKDWDAIAALVPGRTKKQCHSRWRNTLDPSINQASGRTCKKWNEDEDIELKNAVHKHGSKDWAAITALVQGRTSSQCRHRWREVLVPRTNQANGRTGKWREEEDIELKNAVHKHGGKDWAAIAALVQGRTSSQCQHRWRDVSNRITNRANGRAGKWEEGEDIALKNAVHKHRGEDWVAVAALVSGRTRKQCQNRWRRLPRRDGSMAFDIDIIDNDLNISHDHDR
jgi:hypothetical protein